MAIAERVLDKSDALQSTYSPDNGSGNTTAPTPIQPYREITPQGKYILNCHPGQTRAWLSTARYPVMSAGTQAGKTCFEPDWLRREINTKGEGDYLAVTATFPLLEKKMLPEFIYVFETAFRLGEYMAGKNMIQFHHVPGGTNGQVKVIDSTRVMFGSGNKPDSIESATAKAAVADEAGQKDFLLGSWEAMQRRLSINQGRCLFGTTLYNSGWFVQDILGACQRNDPDYELIQFDSTMNPTFPVEEYEKQRAKLPPWKFAMFYRGIFLRPAGLVFDCFDTAEDVIDRFEIPKTWLIHSMHDFGSANPAALFTAQDPATGQFYHFEEYLPGPGRGVYDHVQEFKRITQGYNVVSRYGGNWTTEDEIRQAYTMQGWPIAKPKHRDPQLQYELVYGMNALHKIKVMRHLNHYLDQKTSFSYVLDERYNPTDKYEDEASQHLLACERYGMSNFTPETVVNLNQSRISEPSRRDRVGESRLRYSRR